MRRNLFLQFLNRDSREVYRLFDLYEPENHYRLLYRALNAAILLCEEYCTLPPGFIVEDDIAFRLGESQRYYLSHRLLHFPLREGSLADYAEKKRSEYSPMRDRYSGLFSDTRLDFLANNAQGLIRRKSHIAENIVSDWSAGPDLSKRVWRPVQSIIAPGEIAKITQIPQRLFQEGVAVTWSAIEPQLDPAAREAARPLRNILQYTYMRHYCEEYSLVTLCEIPQMMEEFFLPRVPKVYSFARLQTFLSTFDISTLLLDASAEFMVRLKYRHGMIAFMDAFVQLADRSESLTDLMFAASRARRASTFDWRGFAMRFTAFVKEPNDVEVVELDDGLADLAAELVKASSLETRSPALATKTETGSAKRIVRGGQQEMPEVVLFVALEEELEVLVKGLGLTRNIGSPAATGELAGTKIALLCPKQMGRVAAAVEVSRYLGDRRTNPPTILLVVGLAGGFPDRSKQGHIICADKVVDLALRKVIDGDDKRATANFRRSDFDLDMTIRDVVTSNQFDEKAWIDACLDQFDWPRDRRPSFHTGPLASVDEVVSSDEWSKALMGSADKLLGVEMEAGGVCAAAKAFKVPVSMLRVVSDLADPAKVDDRWRKTGMQTLAALLTRLPIDAWLAAVKAR